MVTVTLARPLDEYRVRVTQDTAGNYKIEYTDGETTRIEERRHDGSVSGSYSYVDSNGVLQTIQYVSGPQGFVVLDGSPALVDLAPQFSVPVGAPLPVQYTPEVAAARAEHLALVEAAKRNLVL